MFSQSDDIRNLSSIDLSELEYRRIRVQGHYDENSAIYIGPKTYDGTHGFHVLSPFVRSGDGATIIVNRGFITRDHLAKVKTTHGRENAVLGLLRQAPGKHWSSSNNVPGEDKWYWLDVKAIMKYFGRKCDAEPFCGVYMEELFQGDSGDIKGRLAEGIPIGRAADVDFRNTHATYAFIW